MGKRVKASTARRARLLKKPSQIVSSLLLIFAATTTALLAMISIEIGLLSAGVFALCVMIFNEGRRRQFWEQAASYKFKTIADVQDMLTRETVMNSKAIEELQADSTQTRKNIAGLEQQISEARQSNLPVYPVAFKADEETTVIEEPVSEIRAKKRPPVITTTMDDDTLSDTVVKELVDYAVDQKRVDVFVQPIVRLPQRQTRFFEIYARIRARAGQYIPAGRYMPVAEQDNTDREIDHLLLLHCLKTLRGSAHVKNAAPFFINIKSELLHDQKFMQVFLAFMAKNRDLAPRLIFEIQQNDYEAMPLKLREVMRALGRLGCSFSLDHVANLNMNIADLQHFKVRFVKIEAAKLLEASSGTAFTTMHKQKRKLEANGIGVIVEKIETEEHMRAMLDFDLHYGQGYLFGKPELEGAYREKSRVRRKGWQETVA